MKKYKGAGIQMNKTEYEKAIQHPVTSNAPVYFLSNAAIPVLFRRVKTVKGSCFSLHTEELATTEQMSQGSNVYSEFKNKRGFH